MDEKPGTFTDLFGYLASPAAPETLAVEYIAREFQADRPLGEIFEDEYLTERFTPEQLEALLDRWDLAGILGEEAIERYRNPDAALEDGTAEEGEGDEEGDLAEGDEDEDEADEDAEEDEDGEVNPNFVPEAQADSEEGAAESPDAWAAEWAGVELPEADESEQSDDAESDKPAV